MKYAVLLALVIVAAACQPRPPAAPGTTGLRLPDRIRVRTKGQVVSVPLEDYTLGSVLAEVSPTGESPATVERIFEVQAVLARSYAVAELGRHEAEGFDLCDATHCQLYDPARIQTSRFAALARQAVQATAGRVLTFQGRIALTFFHADCGGTTDAADAVWGGEPIPYLLGAPDLAGTHHTWTSTLSAADLARALDAASSTAVGPHLDAVDVTTRDRSGRAVDVALRGAHPRVLAGDEFRQVVNRTLGDRALDSTKFTVVRDGTRFTFRGSGFGHGVGLCQLGAAARARRGDSLVAILGQYFPGAALTR